MAAVVRLRARWTRLVRQSSAWLLLPFGLVIAWWAGSAAPLEGGHRTLVLMVAVAAGAGPVAWALVPSRLRQGFMSIELPLLLLLLSTLTFRIRTAADLAYDPLDSAAQFRVLCVLTAGLLGAVALTRPRSRAAVQELPSPFFLYSIYIVVVFLGAWLSVNTTLTAYRAVELLAGVVVVAGARKSYGREALPRIEATLYWFAVALIASAWIGALVAPSSGIQQFKNTAVPIQWELSGVFPAISSNGLGELAVFLIFWSPLRTQFWRSRTRPSWLAFFLCGVGLITLLAAQYRTGYIATAVGLIVVLVATKRWVPATAIVLIMAAVLSWFPSIVTEAEPYALRGQTVQEAQGLSSRVDWWAASIPVWQKSPFLGKGLLTATRFEVLAPLGEVSTAGIHSTWVEALVGTGVVGVAMILLALAWAWRRAVRAARGPDGWILPIVIVSVITVRSITGTTIEVFGYDVLLFLWLSLALAARPVGSNQTPIQA
jgi:O-antigen ligase